MKRLVIGICGLLICCSSGTAAVRARHPRQNETNIALCQACKENQYDTALELVKTGANVNFCNKNNQSCLHWAAYAGNLELVKLLIKEGAIIDCCDFNNDTPLLFAIYGNHQAVVEYLIKSGGANLELGGRFGKNVHEALTNIDKEHHKSEKCFYCICKRLFFADQD